jgi:hypothetical protein
MNFYKFIFFSLIILSSQLLTNCFVPPTTIFKLEPQTNDIEWYKGKEIATVTNDSVSIIISFDRSLNDDYLFDLDIINYSEKTLFVEPQKFSYKMISGTRMQNELFVPTPAKDPESYILELQKGYSIYKNNLETQNMINSLGGFLQFALQTKAFVNGDFKSSNSIYNNARRMKEDELVNAVQNQMIGEFLANSYYIWEILALRKTTLRKNESISGKVFFPVKEKAKKLEFTFPIGENELKIFFNQEVFLP